MAARTASVEGARAETVMMTVSVDIDLAGVGAGVRSALEAEHQTETGGRKSKPKHSSGDYMPN
jgi:hypothetical protein